MISHRIERWPLNPEWDSRARRAIDEIPVFFPVWRALSDLLAFSVEVYWVKTNAWSCLREAALREIFADPFLGVSDETSAFPSQSGSDGRQWWCLEKCFRTGVTDNPGQVLAEAIALVTDTSVEARSGRRLWLRLPTQVTRQEVERYAAEVFHNALIERVEVWSEAEAREASTKLFSACKPDAMGKLDAQPNPTAAEVERFDIAKLPLDALERLSDERLWALTRDELAAIKAHYERLRRPMTDVEIEIIAQTWSEHCKHKIFAANITVENERSDLCLPARVESVFKTYIRGATKQVPAPYLKSVFEDNAGVINVTPMIDCAIKVETHNSPSALDPFGGALTGIVGVNRDILGVGLGAHPIANLDVFCVGPLDAPEVLPPRLHHPRRVLEGVRLGVEDGGNKSGIPTVTGAVVHHPGYLGKPLVFCGTIGVMPTSRHNSDGNGLPFGDLIKKEIFPGDKIVMAGGRIGKDGIHGATFSSLEMNESSPVSAVQLGDPLTQRRVWDFLIEARDQNLFRAVTDNGAGGLSSSIGELARLCGKKGGASMDVSLAATKYDGLKPYELTVSESQERMSFAVPPEKLEAFLSLAVRRGVECSVLGEFDDSGRFEVSYADETVADLDMHFLHEGVPVLELSARVPRPFSQDRRRYGQWKELREPIMTSLALALPAVLALPNVRTRRPIVEQYDHEVQARTVRKPYGTPKRGAPNDGATLRLDRVTLEGLALGLGLAPYAAEIDPKVAAELAVDEAVRNAVVAGLDPAHAALVDNFCWPDPLPSQSNPDAREKLGALVTTCHRIFEAAVELKMPFVSGKDSMKNDYRMGDVKISVPPTLLITVMGKVRDVSRVPSGFAVGAGRRVLWVSGQDVEPSELGLPRVDFNRSRAIFSALHGLILDGLVESAHDVGDGGWLATTAEMFFGTSLGADLDLRSLDLAWGARAGEPSWARWFYEPATSFVLIVESHIVAELRRRLSNEAFEPFIHDVGGTVDSSRLSVETGQGRVEWSIDVLQSAYDGGGA